MRVLLVESTPGHAREVASWLGSAGHEVGHCFDSPASFGCRGVARHEDCPLETHTDMALLVRDLDDGCHTLSEMGAVCAMRHRVPVVEIVEPHGHGLDTTLLGAIAAAEYRTDHAEYERAAHRALAAIPSLERPERVQVVVTLEPGRVHAMLHVPSDLDAHVIATMVDRVGRAVRQHDPYSRVIDVGVRR